MNARVYSFLLSLYPAELRNDFGAEMMQIFLEDLADSRHGFPGAVRVWWRVLKETVCIAMPPELWRREIAVPVVMYILQAFYFGTILLLAPRAPGSNLPKSVGDIIALVVGTGFFPSFVAFVAIRVGDRSLPEPLNLGPINVGQ